MIFPDHTLGNVGPRTQPFLRATLDSFPDAGPAGHTPLVRPVLLPAWVGVP